jgi:hypothetical protein
VLSLLAAAVAVSVGARHSDASAARARVLHELPRLEAFVAERRGHAWTQLPHVEVLSDAAFVHALQSDDGSGQSPPADDPDDVGTTYAAMGLVPDAKAFYSADDSLLASNVTGFYDDVSKTLVVRGTTWTPEMEYTLVHELTHAMQDQVFDLSALTSSPRNDDESAFATRAVVEGDAERIAEDYFDTQPQSWQDAVDAAENGAGRSSAPIVDIVRGAPYAVGLDFADGLYEQGGTEAVDSAFRSPPTTSQQLLHPQAWLAGKEPAPAEVPYPDEPAGDLADRGVLGELGLWAAVDADHPHLSDVAALDGWDGDAYVATDGDQGACFVDRARFVDGPALDKALDFLSGWTAHHGIAVQRSGTREVVLSACRS